MSDDSHGSIAASASERGADRGAEPGQQAQPDDSHGSIAASASVATATPERYAKQLASHLGRRCEVRAEAAGTRIVLPDGNCLLRAVGQSLVLEATATGEPALDRVTHVVGSHLERFGQRNELAVEWHRP